MNSKSSRRSEQAGMLRFGREMTSALIMAIIFIIYAIQAFKIPTGSMERSLLIGDFLLGLKFMYGSPVVPFSYQKLPSVTEPKPGDVVIFEYPGNDFEVGSVGYSPKDFIKRCVAGPGQVVESQGMNLTIDGKKFVLPPRGQYIYNGMLSDAGITDFAPLRIPRKGDTIYVDSLPVREFFFLRNLIEQENPGSRLGKFWQGTAVPILARFGIVPRRERPDDALTQSFPNVSMGFSMLIDGKNADTATVFIQSGYGLTSSMPFSTFAKKLNLLMCNYTSWPLLNAQLEGVKAQIQERYPGHAIMIGKELFLHGKRVYTYFVKNNCYFMMGDNRDNSADSRYWGYVDRNFVKAKAFILYFSLDSDKPWTELWAKIRWDRIGKLIRSWNGLNPPHYYK